MTVDEMWGNTWLVIRSWIFSLVTERESKEKFHIKVRKGIKHGAGLALFSLRTPGAVRDSLGKDLYWKRAIYNYSNNGNGKKKVKTEISHSKAKAIENRVEIWEKWYQKNVLNFGREMVKRRKGPEKNVNQSQSKDSEQGQPVWA